MIIDVPYEYDAIIYRKKIQRARFTSEARYIGFTSVDVAEATDEDMPIAAQWRNPERYAKGVSKPEVLRWRDGRLWTHANDASATKSLLGSRLPYEHPMGFAFREGAYAQSIAEDDPHLAEIVHARIDSSVSQARRNAEKFTLLNGELWIEAVEPILAIQYHDDHIEVVVRNKWKNDWAAHTYPIDSLEQAATNHLDKHRKTARLPKLDLRMPEAFTASADIEALQNVSEDLKTWMAEKIASDGIAFFTSFQRLRDALAALDRTEDDSVLALKDALSDALTTSLDHGERNKDTYNEHPSNLVREHAEQAIQRIDLRYGDAAALMAL